MSSWQDILTAPRDQWILVFDPEGVPDTIMDDACFSYDDLPRLNVFLAQWKEREWIACFGKVDGWGCPSGGYDHWVAGLIVNPTHWMPLPSPPGAAK